MKLKLCKEELHHSRNVSDPASVKCIEYKVMTTTGANTAIRIGRFGDADWRIRRTDLEPWSGSYSAPDEAVAELQNEYDAGRLAI